jgi:hypothetical protein
MLTYLFYIIFIDKQFTIPAEISVKKSGLKKSFWPDLGNFRGDKSEIKLEGKKICLTLFHIPFYGITNSTAKA